MIWAYEYLTTQQLKELEKLNPLMDFTYKDGMCYHKTFCAGLRTIYENDQPIETPVDKKHWFNIPIDLIDCYPNEEDCIDNVPEYHDSYGFLMNEIKRGHFGIAYYRRAIGVTPRSGRFLTIEATRLMVFRDAVALGYQQFSSIPAYITKSLKQEIRHIRLFRLEHTKQGFICDDWEEAKNLSMYMQGMNTVKNIIEDSYKWTPDYLASRKENCWLEIIAIPVTAYMKHYANNNSALEWIELDLLMSKS
ncbi:MAG: hypothetical protein QME52_08945 [Bacteroidota bacterium]|nr:hypothetical protein [Bacteroidota bacterium]